MSKRSASPLRRSYFQPPEEPPPKTPEPPPKRPIHKADLGRFIGVGLLVLLILLAGHAYTRSQTFVAEGREAAELAIHDLEGALHFLARQDFKKADFLFQSSAQVLSDLKKDPLAGGTEHFRSKWKGAPEETLRALIEAGQGIAALGQRFTRFVQDSKEIPKTFLEQNLRQKKGGPVLTGLLRDRQRELRLIQGELSDVSRNLKRVSVTLLPDNLRDPVARGRRAVDETAERLRVIQGHFDAVLRALGDPLPHSYLVLFQNRHERRATGGFIGSYALMDVNSGRVTKLEFKDVYASDGQLDTVVPPPPGIARLTDRYAMRDANYYPHFPESADQIRWFLEHSRGPSVDTVIAIDQKVIEEMLRLTGPIPLGYFGLTVDADNFSTALSYLIESKLISENDPKQPLRELLPRFREELLNNKNYTIFINTISDLIVARHIQAHSADPEVQKLIESFGLDGALIDPPKKADFLGLVTTSVSGNKSDRYIKEEIQHRSYLAADGSVKNQLSLNRTHTWNDAAYESVNRYWRRFGSGELNRDTLFNILGRGDNRPYLRVYVPKGSTLLDAEGVDQSTLLVSKEGRYTVFGFELPPLPAGHTQTVTLRYTLPFRLDPQKDDYLFIIQKQAGATGHLLEKIVELEPPLRAAANHPEPTTQSAGRVVHRAPITQNRFFVTALE